MLRWFCTLLLPAMTGGRCHRRKKVPETAAEGSAEERPCPVPTVSAQFPATVPEIPENSTALEIDYFSQSRKALSERSPFDVAEETSASSSTVPTLPVGLATFLSRHSDTRRRHKKSHSGAEKKSSKKLHCSNVWVDTEEYFRDLILPDIDILFEASSLSRCLVSRKWFSIPLLENAPRFHVVSCENENVTDENVNGVGIDSVAAAEEALPQNDKYHATSDSCVSLDWFLGCRNKVSLTSERPSKKRKLLGGDAGLEKVLITSPCDRDLSFCHFCGRGDTGMESNRLIVCSSCNVAVHQKCYGVEDDVDKSWLCSWCAKKDDIGKSSNPCVLCPNKGGALKPVNTSGESAGSVQFAHLFCCLWMPEVYVDDLKKMEPVMNVGGISETRKKLVCNVCKVKCGACVRCSHGTCRTSFHPLCAREARHKMEVWAKYGYDNVELRAFCIKHSDLPENSSILPSRDTVAVGSKYSDANRLPVRSQVHSEHNLKIGCRNGENIEIASDSRQDKLGHDGRHDGPQYGGLSDCRLNEHDMLGCSVTQQLCITGVMGRTNENASASDSVNFALILKKLIDRGKVDIEDVALEIGVSPDTLTANTNVCMAPDVQLKIVNWLKAHVYTNAFQKGLKVKFKPANSSKDESGAIDGSDNLLISDLGLLDPVTVKSVPPRRRTISNITILKDNKVIGSSEVVFSENGMPMDKIKVGAPDHENPGTSNEASIPDATEISLDAVCDAELETPALPNVWSGYLLIQELKDKFCKSCCHLLFVLLSPFLLLWPDSFHFSVFSRM